MKYPLLLSAALLQAPQSTVEGVAINAGSADPIPHARVMLTKVDGHLADTRVARTDDRGRFTFRSIAPGSYRLLAQHEAFVRASGRPLTVAPGQLVRDLVVAMTPTGVITGRVVDEHGDPVPDAYVRATVNDATFETTTNDLGEYRLFGLPPGAYTVSAAPYLAPRLERTVLGGRGTPQNMIVTPTRPSPYSPGEGRGLVPLPNVVKNGDFIPFMALRGESHETVYYPGTTDAAAAAPIEVPAGAVVVAINFTTAVRRADP